MSPDKIGKTSFSLRRTSVAAAAAIAVEEEAVAVAGAAVATVVDDGITKINEGDDVRFLVDIGNSNKVCEDQESCKECFHVSLDCSWTIVSDKSGNSVGRCSNDPCPNTLNENDGRRSLSLISCGRGVSVEEKDKVKKKILKKENRLTCKKLTDSVPTRPPNTCSDRSGDCVDCLKSTTTTNKKNNDDECVWVPETNTCEIDCFQVADATSCVTGSLPKKKAKKECKVLQKQRKNSNKCQKKSGCTECVETSFQQYKKKENGTFKKEEASCQWFPPAAAVVDNGFVRNDSNSLESRCDSTCTTFRDDCNGVTNTCPFIISKPDKDDEDELIIGVDGDGDGDGDGDSDTQNKLDIMNNVSCSSNGIDCKTCLFTTLIEHDGVSITPPRTCQWYLLDDDNTEDVFTIGESRRGVCLDRCYDSTKEQYNRDIDCTAIKYVTTCAADVDDGGDSDEGGDGNSDSDSKDEDEDEATVGGKNDDGPIRHLEGYRNRMPTICMDGSGSVGGGGGRDYIILRSHDEWKSSQPSLLTIIIDDSEGMETTTTTTTRSREVEKETYDYMSRGWSFETDGTFNGLVKLENGEDITVIVTVSTVY